MNNLTIHIPAVSEGRISEDLRRLTLMLDEDARAAYEEGGFYGLGGASGYGVEYENDTFMMHPFCWCERDDCDWCLGCECPEDATIYHGPDGTVVEWDEFFDRGGYTWGDSIPVPEKQCDYCAGRRVQAPNFLHKPTGTRVEWYKYIGRGMEVDLRGDWDAIFRDVIASIGDHR